MSTDYSAVCMTCRRSAHLFVRFTSGPAFAHGSNDAAGRLAIANWLLDHLREGHDMRVMVDDAVPDGFVHERPEEKER